MKKVQCSKIWQNPVVMAKMFGCRFTNTMKILGRHWSDHIYGNHHTHCCDSGHHKGCSSLPGGQVLKGCLETFCKVDFQVEDSVSTFIPLEQKKASKIKYTGHGFIPCDGWDKSLEGNLIEVVIHYRIVPCPFSRPGDE